MAVISMKLIAKLTHLAKRLVPATYYNFSKILCAVVITTIVGGIIWVLLPGYSLEEQHDTLSFLKSDSAKPVQLTSTNLGALPRDKKCTFHTCLDIYHCGYNDQTRIRVYVYPLQQYVDENGAALTLPISREFYELLQAVVESPFYTDDPTTACLYVPSLDLLNQNNLRLKETSQILTSLPW
jgi:glucuronyl/N-acetylglucosaminyl transferase EXT2